jgi:tetratricopeptide (TPR) repeat protein
VQRALRLTDRLPEPERNAARARLLITLAWPTLALHGLTQALSMLSESRTQADSPRLRALSWVQESVVHVSCQDWRSALAALDRVGEAMSTLTVPEQVAAHINAGLAHLSLLDLASARADLKRAQRLSAEHGLRAQEFKARHNLGCLEYYAGRLPTAIRLMREADEMDVPVDRVRAQRDLALVLLEAGLLRQARDTLLRALAEARRAGHRLEAADLHVDLATTALARGDSATARQHLDRALGGYRARGAGDRQRSTALLRASVEVAEGKSPRGLDSLLAPWLSGPHPVTAEERTAARVHVEALLLRGDLDAASVALGHLGTSRRQGLAADMHDRLLRARVAEQQGDRQRARRTVRRAITRLMAVQAPTQSLEIRAALALHGERLAAFDIDDAVASGSASRVFDAVERWRAVSHRLAPVTNPVGSRAAELLGQLRQARLQVTSSGEAGARQRARVAELEWEVSRLEWGHAHRSGAASGSAAIRHHRARELLAARGEQALVMVAQSGQEYLLTLTGRGSELHHLGPVAQVGAMAAQLSRDLRAKAFATGNPALEATLAHAVAQSAAALDHRLFAAVPPDDTPLLVVPGQALMSVPWHLLPSLAGRPVTVSPSATRWAGGVADDRRQDPTTVCALAGPGLAGSDVEVAEVASAWQAAVPVTSRTGATSTDLGTALGRSTLVHVAAHGTHEDQSPFFSSLRMADGPVFAHELPRPVAAEHVVLSACEVGRSDLHPGDEPLGLTAALLTLGATCVVAAVAPVRDEVASRAMVSYHRYLAAGRPAAAALAATVAEHPDASAFCVFGSDWAAAR